MVYNRFINRLCYIILKCCTFLINSTGSFEPRKNIGRPQVEYIKYALKSNPLTGATNYSIQYISGSLHFIPTVLPFN